MTVPATSRKAGPYTGTGVQTVFPFSFKIFASTDIKVVVADAAGSETTLSTGYTVSMNADQVASPGGNVTLSAALTTGYKLSVLGNLPYDQTLALPGGGNFNPVALENDLDRLAMQVQQVVELSGRALVQGATATGTGGTLPSGVSFSVLGWDSTGTNLVNYNSSSLGVAISYAVWRTETFSGTGAQTAFVLANDAGTADNCDVSVGGSDQINGLNFSYNSTTKTLTFLTGAPPVGTNNVKVRYGQALPVGTITAVGITDSTAFGRSVLTAANAAAAGIGGGATGGGTDTIFNINKAAMTTSYSLPAGYNANTVGPLTIPSGLTLTVPSGQRLVVL
jgi:hypothetical protein